MAIKIKPKNKGKFTAYAKKKGMVNKEGKITDEAIEAGLKSKNPKTRQRANFARNQKKFNRKKK